jgi:histidinol-phosphatase (PHP family)
MSHKTEDGNRLKEYVDRVLTGVATGKYLYVGHPDLINFAGPKEVYQRHMRRLCEGLKEAGMPLEINLLGMAEGRRYPNPLFWEIAKEIGNSAIIGVDAHAPEQFLRSNIVEKSKNWAVEYGLELVDKDLIL